VSPDEQKQIERQIKQAAPALLRNLPGDKKQQLFELFRTGAVVQQTAQVTHTTSSPVPPAELLDGYNHAIPDGGNRLFSLIERQSAHRQELETKVIDTQMKAIPRGQWLAFVAICLLSAIGVYFGIAGHEKISATIFATTIVSVAGLFIAGRIVQEKNLDKKRPGS
jgi:uncharacterized membrane protein